MELVLEVPLLCVASLFLCKVLWDIICKKISTLSFLYIIFYVFYILPMVYTFNNKNIFYNLYNYSYSFYDEMSIIISLFINFIVVLFFIFNYKVVKIDININFKNKGIIYLCRLILFIIIIGILFLILKSPDPTVYLTYGSVISEYDPILKEYHSTVAMMCRLLIFVAAINFLFLDKNKFSYIFYIILAFIACWFGAKRSFVAYSLLIFLLSLFFSFNFSPKKILNISLFSIIFFISYTNYYQNNIRDFGVKSSQEKIENILIDYSRLQNERYVIFNLINNKPIVPYYGASFVYSIGFYVPRVLWNEKPYPYAVYYTNSFFNIEDVEDRLKWGLTTGLLDELLANFYWLGIFLYLLLIKIFVNYNDKYINGLPGLVGIVVGCLMLIVHFAAFSYIFILWLIMLLFGKKRKQKTK